MNTGNLIFKKNDINNISLLFDLGSTVMSEIKQQWYIPYVTQFDDDSGGLLVIKIKIQEEYARTFHNVLLIHESVSELR